MSGGPCKAAVCNHQGLGTRDGPSRHLAKTVKDAVDDLDIRHELCKWEETNTRKWGRFLDAITAPYMPDRDQLWLQDEINFLAKDELVACGRYPEPRCGEELG